MLYGISGAHRSGKSTLASMVAGELGLTYHATSTSEVARKHGIDPVAPMTLAQRLDLQIYLLQNHIAELDKLPRPAIVDRTPLDFLGYTLAEFGMTSHLMATEAQLEQAKRFADLCLKATARLYDTVFYINPLPVYEVDPTKPAPNPAFQWHHALLVQGAMSQLQGQVTVIPIFNSNLQVRVDTVHDHIVKRLDEIDVERKTARYLQ